MNNIGCKRVDDRPNYLQVAFFFFIELLVVVFYFSEIDVLRKVFSVLIIVFGLMNLYLFDIRITLSKNFIIKILLCILFLACQACFNHFQMSVMFNLFLMLMFIIFLIEQRIHCNGKTLFIARESFYWIYLSGIIYSMLFASHMFGDDFIFNSLRDVNWTGVIFFFLFIYSYYNKRIVGLLVYAYYVMHLNTSRGLLLMTICFFITVIFKKQITKIFNMKFLKKTWVINLFLTIFMFIFSFLWLINFSVDDLSEHRDSFNDRSNMMRFTANMYALERVIEDERLLYSGYDLNLGKELGVEDSSGNIMTTVVDGVAIVHPHNGCINLMLYLGVIPMMFTVFLISEIIDYYREKGCIEYILPILINSCFLWLYWINWLVGWFWILFLISSAKRPQKYRM